MTGSLADAINSDVVKISIAGGEFITVYDIEYSKEPPRNRTSTRGGKIDMWGPPLEDIWCSAVVDEATFDILETATTPNSRRAYTDQAIVVTGEALSGSDQDITISFTAEIPTMKILAPQGGVATAVRFYMVAK